MNFVMLRRTLLDLRWTVFWYAIGLLVYAIVILSLYPMFRDPVTLSDVS
jgi:ABC-2 type transport system permease protein